MAADSLYSMISGSELLANIWSNAIATVVVDDSERILDIICALLESNGAVVVGRAADGVQALEAVAKLRPDLLVMDIDMPRLNGMQATAILAEHFPDMKIILMSAEDSPKLRRQCNLSGAHAFTCKINFMEGITSAMEHLFQTRCSTITA